MDTYNRSNFYSTIQVNNGTIQTEKDLNNNTFSNFKPLNDVVFYVITDSDIQRPDLLSLKIYGSMSYWWILSIINEIDDWWNDLKVGDVIKIPNLSDIEDFYFTSKGLK